MPVGTQWDIEYRECLQIDSWGRLLVDEKRPIAISLVHVPPDWRAAVPIRPLMPLIGKSPAETCVILRERRIETGGELVPGCLPRETARGSASSRNLSTLLRTDIVTATNLVPGYLSFNRVIDDGGRVSGGVAGTGQHVFWGAVVLGSHQRPLGEIAGAVVADEQRRRRVNRW